MKKKIIGAVALLFSMILMGYPFLSEWIFENRQDSIIETYSRETSAVPDETLASERQKAVAYNLELASGHVEIGDPFEDTKGETEDAYLSLLNLQGNGCMGYVEIPCIDVNLPIYHGTSERVLQNGAGHLPNSSLPVGGDSTHAVLTGHTGLNRARLFTDLTQLEPGDIFFLYVLNEKLAYEVDQIKVVEPQETSPLEICAGEDLCTLVTCTPYGINSHRLLVRGHRVPYTEESYVEAQSHKKTENSEWKRQYKKALGMGIVVILVILGSSEIIRWIRNKRKQKN